MRVHNQLPQLTAEQLIQPRNDQLLHPRGFLANIEDSMGRIAEDAQCRQFKLLIIKQYSRAEQHTDGWISANVEDHRGALLGAERTEEWFGGQNGETHAGRLVEQSPERAADSGKGKPGATRH